MSESAPLVPAPDPRKSVQSQDGPVDTMKLHERSLYFLGFALLSLGLVMHVVGLVTPTWTVGTPYFPDASVDKLYTVRAFAILQMLFGVAAGLTLVWNYRLSVLREAENKPVALGSIAASVSALASALIYATIWCTCFYESGVTSLGYSFALCSVGGLFILVGGYAGFREFQTSQRTI